MGKIFNSINMRNKICKFIALSLCALTLTGCSLLNMGFGNKSSSSNQQTSHTTSQTSNTKYGSLYEPLTIYEALQIPLEEHEYVDNNGNFVIVYHSAEKIFVRGTVLPNSVYSYNEKNAYYRGDMFIGDDSIDESLKIYTINTNMGDCVFINDTITAEGYLQYVDGQIAIAGIGYNLGSAGYSWVRNIVNGVSTATVEANAGCEITLSTTSGVNGETGRVYVSVNEGFSLAGVRANRDNLVEISPSVFEFTFKGPMVIRADCFYGTINSISMTFSEMGYTNGQSIISIETSGIKIDFGVGVSYSSSYGDLTIRAAQSVLITGNFLVKIALRLSANSNKTGITTDIDSYADGVWTSNYSVNSIIFTFANKVYLTGIDIYYLVY